MVNQPPPRTAQLQPGEGFVPPRVYQSGQRGLSKGVEYLAVTMKNISGGVVRKGAVAVKVVPATAEGYVAFTTIGLEGHEHILGVTLEDIPDDGVGQVAVLGFVEFVRVSGAVSQGDYLQQSGTAELADDAGSALVSGAFAVAASNSATFGADTAVSALIGILPGNVHLDTTNTTQIDIGDTVSAGTATRAAHSDHQHAFPAPATGYPVDLDGTGESDGAATTPARSDHKHNLASGATLTAPTISDFTNAGHDHGDTNDGGPLVVAALPSHGATEHDNRTRRVSLSFSNTAQVALAESDTGWAQGGADAATYIYLPFSTAAGNDGTVAFCLFKVPTDWVSGSTFEFLVTGDGTAANNAVMRVNATVLAATDQADEAAQTADATVAIALTADEVSVVSAAPSITGLAAGSWVRVTVTRRPTDAADVYAGSVRLLDGLSFEYTADS